MQLLVLLSTLRLPFRVGLVKSVRAFPVETGAADERFSKMA